MKQRILLSIVTIFASITALYGQMDSWMLNQWLNQMNMDTYQQQQKIFQDFQNLVKEEAKRQDANATAVCVLLPGGGDTFFAHIQTVYISHSRIEIIDRDEDGYETRAFIVLFGDKRANIDTSPVQTGTLCNHPAERQRESVNHHSYSSERDRCL